MKRIEIKKPKLNPHFIGSWEAVPASLCDDIIYFFETNIGKQKVGLSVGGLNKSAKCRTDISIPPSDISLEGYGIFQDYFRILHSCYREYLGEWPILKEVAHTLDIGSFNIGRYCKGQHFNGIHCERTPLSLQRVLAFMTYLNDVDGGGSTYFSHFDLQIEPQKGLTLIWPTDWTHAHKGNTIKEGNKYIITGWLDLA